MGALTEDRRLAGLVRAAIASSGPLYRAAVAASIRGAGSDLVEWERWRRATARALMLATLEGMSKATRALRLMGVRLDLHDGRELPRLVFARRGDKAAFDRKPTDLVQGEAEPYFTGFEVGPFTEAIEAFRSRVPRLSHQVATLQRRIDSLSTMIAAEERSEAVASLASRSAAAREALNRSFWVTGVGERATISLRELLASAIEGGVSVRDGEIVGVTLPDFIDRAKLAGARRLTDARLETVYRNNLNAAFNDGQFAVVNDDEVQHAIPLLMLVEIHDRRTRGAPGTHNPGKHWQMHGYVNTPAEFQRLGIIPPAGHNCRGGLRPVPYDEAVELGLIGPDGRPDAALIRKHNGARVGIIERGEYPDPGWVRRHALVAA